MKKRIKVSLVIGGILVGMFLVGCASPGVKMCREYDNSIGAQYDTYVKNDTSLTPDEKNLRLKSHKDFQDALKVELNEEK